MKYKPTRYHITQGLSWDLLISGAFGILCAFLLSAWFPQLGRDVMDVSVFASTVGLISGIFTFIVDGKGFPFSGGNRRIQNNETERDDGK